MGNIKKFEDFFDKMRGLLDNAKKQGHIIVRVEDIENTFPELKENEDEKIRKKLISFVENSGKVVKITDDAYLLDTGQGIPFSCEHNVHLWNVTKDAKEGDVLAFYCEYKGNKMVQVGIIEKYVGKHGGCSNTFKIYVGVNWENNLKIGEHMGSPDIRPATKEQRDTLEKAMTDAGYTFDFERKELKKLSQSEVTKMSDQEEIAEIPFGAKDSELQEAIYYVPKGFHAEIDDDKVVIKKDEKPTAWSEEDEQITLSIEQVMNCASLLNIVPEKTDKIRTWLKSLKQRIGR